MSNVIKGKFSELEDVSIFIQPENGDRAVDVALGLNEEIDKQGFCTVTVWHSDTKKPTPFEPDRNKWFITYNFPDGYEHSYVEAEFKDLPDACYFVMFCHITCSKIENKSLRCLTPGDPFEAMRLKTEQRFMIKVDLIPARKPNERKLK
jgi:hypothetical protein